MFCSNGQCDGIMNLTNPKNGKPIKGKKLECPKCGEAVCKECKHAYHGEKKPCPIDDE